MDTVISFTPGQILALAAAFSTLCVSVGWVVKIVRTAKAPKEALEKRVADLEAITKNYAEFFANDKRRLDSIEEGNRVTSKAILALLRHSIDGNDIDSLKAAENDLHEYLLKKS